MFKVLRKSLDDQRFFELHVINTYNYTLRKNRTQFSTSTIYPSKSLNKYYMN